ncbi:MULTISPECIES: hypothetical protein [Pseudomonas]|uniref:hypothetical protein n=1 Tax=Pseudomonas TaxID=286 RepID=UPI001C65ECB7|nr:MULTISPECIES: hypothetical protein [unclassified Pseudomonas]MBW8128422.1 hypothetical protein [Pseudomonas sp. LAP_36]MBW8138022.1 hypothetical protein [Pseudomonas sp. PAMC 26818]
MALICNNIEKLKTEITEKYSVTPSEKQTGIAYLFAEPKYNGFIVNVFNTGTVQFQGGFCPELKQQLENLVEFINS